MNKFLFVLLASIVVISCSPKLNMGESAGVDPSLKIVSYSPVQPLLKGLDNNPLMRIGFYLPAKQSARIKNLSVTYNDAASRSIEKLEFYHTGTEPLYADKHLIASTSLTGNAEISVDLQLVPGWNYVWINAFVKSSVDIDDLVEIHINSVEEAGGKKYSIIEEGSFKKRLGIAVRKANDDGVNTFRIPGIATTGKGTLVAVYDIRYKNSADLPGNIDVGMSRSTDGGKTWEPMKVIMDMGEPHENNGVGDPAILFDPATNKIWVAALWSKGNRSIAGSEPGLSPDITGQFVLVSSEDDGITWSKPYSITQEVKDPKWHLYFNGPGNGIVMQNGTLVFPSQYWDESKKPGIPHSSIIYSTDQGKTWRSGTGAKSNTTESQVIETIPGTLMLSMRDNRGNYRTIATTTDMGQTWTEHQTSYNTLVDPVCMASFIKANVRSGNSLTDIIFFGNPASSTSRQDMTIKASMDNGESWSSNHQLMIDQRKCFGYSAMTRIDENTIGFLYEGIRDLYFVRVPVKEILE